MIIVRMIMIITMMIMMIMIMMMMMMMRPMMTIMITLMNKMMAFMTPSARKAAIAHLRWRLPLGAMLAPKSLPRLGGLRSDIQDLGRRGGEVKHNGCRDEERALSRSCYSPSR